MSLAVAPSPDDQPSSPPPPTGGEGIWSRLARWAEATARVAELVAILVRTILQKLKDHPP